MQHSTPFQNKYLTLRPATTIILDKPTGLYDVHNVLHTYVKTDYVKCFLHGLFGHIASVSQSDYHPDGYPTLCPLSLCPRSLCPGHFFPWSLCPRSLCPRSLCPRSLCPLVTLSPRHFVPRSLCPGSLCPPVILSSGHFVPGHFVPDHFVPYI
jgi:hypothetical protein